MKTLFRRTLLCAALAALSAPVFAQSAPPSPFTQTIFFGDSLTDGGFFRPLLPASAQGVTGQFTTNPGFVWSQYLADYFHSNAEVAWTATGAPPPGPYTNAANGNNWAVGGARVSVDDFQTNPLLPLGYTPSLTSQYAAYLAAGNTVDPNALYTVWGGANDIFYAAGVYQATYAGVLMGGGTTGDAEAAAQAAAQPIIGAAVTDQIGLIGAMTQAGAQYVLVPTVPDIGLTPSFAGGAEALGSGLSGGYNDALFGGLATAGLHVIPVDTYSLLNEVVADPSAFGLTNVTGTACLTPTSLICNPSSTVPGGVDTYLFADGVHPTSGAHKALADLAISMIDGPRMIQVLPHSAATVGRSRAVMVDGAVAGMALAQGDGMQWWANVRGDQQRFNDGAGFDGPGVTGSFGIGWRNGNLSYGAFAGYGRQRIDFGYQRGDFRQTDASIGGFVGWNGEHLWATGQLSWSKLNFDVERQVNLGSAMRIHRGSPDGDNLSIGGSAGWNFTHNRWQHGPVVSLLSQNISVDGYAEDSMQSSALAFPDQDGDSLLGSIGWQASYKINDHLKPFARVTWDREFEDAPAQAWAQSRSLTGSLPYAVPGLQWDDSYATVSWGVRGQLFGLDFVTGTSMTVGQQDGRNIGMYLMLEGSF